MLIIEGLSRPGLAPASFSVGTGECVTVAGPSGAGKTLLLRAIADLDPNEGEVVLDGERRSGLAAPEWRRRVAYVPAEAGWWAERISDHVPDQRRAGPLVQSVGLPEGAMDWPVARCSTGERQRLALIRALAGAPRVLLLDEPTAALDGDSRAQVEAVLHQQLTVGITIVLVSHDEGQARRLARRHFAMHAGHLTAVEEA